MWILLAFASSVFAAMTTILAKCGIKKTDSTVATAVRTCVVVVFAWIMVLIVGSFREISNVEPKSWIFLILSGFSTGASWLCYFKALQLGDVNKVVAVDKSSIVFTLLLAFVLLGEPFSVYKGAALVLITAGTYLMVEWKRTEKSADHSFQWLFYALGSAVFAALTSILG
ncbi:MAG: EamA family transporter, partial [Lachnospiraceae bacterium]